MSAWILRQINIQHSKEKGGTVRSWAYSQVLALDFFFFISKNIFVYQFLKRHSQCIRVASELDRSLKLLCLPSLQSNFLIFFIFFFNPTISKTWYDVSRKLISLRNVRVQVWAQWRKQVEHEVQDQGSSRRKNILASEAEHQIPDQIRMALGFQRGYG